MSFSSYLGGKIKQIVAASLFAAILSLAVFPALEIKADNPRFNTLPDDLKLFTGLNVTANQPISSRTGAVTGAANDVFEGVIFYHNGIEGSNAENTTIRVDMPATTTNGQAELVASITATSFDPVFDNLNVSLTGGDAKLTLLPETVKWFPNTLFLEGATPVELPQPGANLISAGINIGSVPFCWEHAGFITFQFKAESIALPQLQIEKTVRNATANETQFVENTTARVNDIVEFKLDVANPGQAEVVSPVVTDILPAELTFLPTNTSNGTAGFIIAEKILPGATVTALLQARVNTDVLVEKIATNRAKVVAGTLSDEDVATVTILPAALERHKSAVNVTTGQAGTALSARAGEEVKYTLITKNNGTAPVDVIVEDGIADILEYADVTEISDGGIITDGTTGLDAKLVRYPVATIAAGIELIRTFTIKVKDPIPTNPAKGFSFDRVMYNKYGDEVKVTIEIPVKKVELAMEKFVRNFTANEKDFVDENEAFPGDVLEYKINFANKGNDFAQVVKIGDALPPNVEYLPGTTVLSLSGVDGGKERTIADGITTKGVVLDVVQPGESGYIKFRVKTAGTIAPGEILINTAILTHKDAKIVDEAKTKLKAVPVVARPEVPRPIKPVLPPSGAAASAGFVSTFLLGVAGTYLKYRKELADAFSIAQEAGSILGL